MDIDQRYKDALRELEAAQARTEDLERENASQKAVIDMFAEQDGLKQARVQSEKADERISVHENTAGISLEALKFYTEWMQRHACGDPEPIEHHYAMQAIEEIESLLPEPPKQEQDDG